MHGHIDLITALVLTARNSRSMPFQYAPPPARQSADTEIHMDDDIAHAQVRNGDSGVSATGCWRVRGKGRPAKNFGIGDQVQIAENELR